MGSFEGPWSRPRLGRGLIAADYFAAAAGAGVVGRMAGRLQLGVRCAVLLAAVAGSGCAEDPPPPRPLPTRAAPDKAALFGDPSLVPTRDGERARRELGQAQEIAAALGVLPAVDDARVDVELGSASTEPTRVLVVVRGQARAPRDALTEQARTIARQVVGAEASVEVLVELLPASPTPEPPPLRWPLALALLGLGFSGGVLIDRAARARRLGARLSPRRGRA